MDKIRKRIAELETKASEAALISDLATSPAARAAYTRIAHSLAEVIAGLQLSELDRDFLTVQAAKCRALAQDTSDLTLNADLQALADEFEAKARG